MRAAVVESLGAPLAVQEVPEPTPGHGELVVRVGACGICGSDLHLSQFMASPGLILGHEYAGTVAAIGPGVDGWKEGDLLAAFPVIGCGTCEPCRAGIPTRCTTVRLLGVGESGGFAEYARVAADGAFRLPEQLDEQSGALVEPLAVALHALDRTPRVADEPVLILGAGPVAIAVGLWVRAFGGEVVMSEPMAVRREVAEKTIGAATVDPTTTDVAAEFNRITGHAPRVVLECVGVPGVIQQAVDLVAPEGHVTVVGACMEPDPWYPIAALMKEATLTFTIQYRPADFARTIRAVASARIEPTPLITGVVDLADLPATFESLRTPTDHVKVLVAPFGRIPPA